MLEEWVSIITGSFRLDLIDSYSGLRRTLLTHKYDYENFYYQPFECFLVPNFDEAFFPELADKFKSNFDYPVPTGVGLLWLQSSNVDATYSKSSSGDLSKIPVKTANVVLKNYVQYEISPSKDGYPYRLDFFFHPGEENLKSLSLIHVIKNLEGTTKRSVIMRIKIIEVETFTHAIDSISEFEGLFDLPVGYGCQRGEYHDRPFAVPINTYMPSYVPHILQLDIVSTQPIDLDHDTDKWKTHQISVRIIEGRLTLNYTLSNDYIILETQDFALKSQTRLPISSDNDSKKVATLRRRKRVWDLGKDGITSKDSQKRVKYFELDERTRQCSDSGENKLGESASIEFGISEQEVGVENGPAAIVIGRKKTILNLNTELIDTLFTSTQDYHLIKKIEPKANRNFRGTIHERRVSKFRLNDNKGNIVWSGPVSFIRKHSAKLTSDVLRQTSSSMYFYSDDLTRLTGKVHMVIVERRIISEANLHRELEDIGKLCFAKILTNNQESKLIPYHKENSDERGLDFVLEYPIESKGEAETLSMSDSIEHEVYRQFIVSMFAVSNGRLNMLQLSNIDIDYGPEMVKISAEISELPASLNYWQDYGQRFSKSKQNLLFTEKNIKNEESCAKSCLNYNCYMFSYCSKSKDCDIVLTKLENSSNKHDGGVVMTFEPDPSCSVFKPKNSPDIKTSNYITPRDFVQKLRQTVLASKGEDKGTGNILKLELEYTSAKHEKVEISLSPLFITSGSFTLEQVDSLLGDISEENRKKITGNNRIEAEYKISFDNRKYKDTLKISEDFPIQLAQHTSYIDCKLLCSQTDCRSFSHCKIESTCRVSMLHQVKQIEDFSENEELCTISRRDYLSKFKQTSDKHVLKLRKISKITLAGSANDCASLCMEEEKFKCKSFYYCRTKKADEISELGKKSDEDESEFEHDVSCYLRKTHLSHLEEKHSVANKTRFQKEERECHLYTRKLNK